MITYEQYLRDSAVDKEVLDVYLDPSENTWAQYDPELGYTLGNYLPRDGLDGCSTISTAQKNGARTPHHYVDRPCRINTYGNSFTQCHQVSDGETWQEYLAAHLGEPIRNFGMGGYGTYQAYRRMLRTEQSELGADNVVLYIWGDDHFRSLMRCRYATIYPRWKNRGGRTFHNNFWCNIEMDLDSGQFVERDSMLPTPESLYKMTDSDFMYDALKDDLLLQLYVAEQVEPSSLDIEQLNALAEILGEEALSQDSDDACYESSRRIRYAYGFAATKEIIKKAFEFCGQHDKKLMVFLFCSSATLQLLGGEPRYEQPIVDYLDENKLPYFDMNLVHVEDYKAFNLSVPDYMKRYFIGHCSPAGNHFFAFSVKDTFVDWLDPKPITYLDDESSVVDFEGYLPD